MPGRRRWGTQAQYAAHRGVPRQTVQKALTSGRIRLHGRLVDFEEADRDWAANTDLSQSKQQPRGPREERLGPHSLGSQFQRVRTAREVVQLRIAKLELEQRSGILVRAEDVRAAAWKAASEVRSALASIPPRIAPRLHAAANVAEVERILMEELRRVSAGIGESVKNGSTSRG